MIDDPPDLLSRSKDRYECAGPTYGQLTFEILTDILGYDGDKIAERAAPRAPRVTSRLAWIHQPDRPERFAPHC